MSFVPPCDSFLSRSRSPNPAQRTVVLDVPPLMDADGVKAPKNVCQETESDLAETLETAQNGFSSPALAQNVTSIKHVKPVQLMHSVAGVRTPELALRLTTMALSTATVIT